MFQFPSNGKGDRKEIEHVFHNIGMVFQFPSNGKGDRKQTTSPHTDGRTSASFNSLQTGKGIASKQEIDEARLEILKAVSIPFKRESGSQARFSRFWKLHKPVSIPFKRERGSQVSSVTLPSVTGTTMFQFPSNGKGDRKRRRYYWRK